ncbi:MAG: tetratricopeptide repeat protein [Bacteroidales bacterium]|nr:tetratricopeptide repeat protein [Bacteroidales bacterium]
MVQNTIKIIVIGLVIMVLSHVAYAQKTAIYDQPSTDYQLALELYNKQQYGPSQNLFQKTINNINDTYSIMRINAEYYKALCAVKLFNDDAELLLLKFIETHPESMYLKHIYFQLGKFQYRKNGYRRVLKSFEQVDVYDLAEDEQIEFYFKRGYSHFKRDSIELAEKNFYEILNKESRYKAPAVYYYSHIAYDKGNYETARKGFMSLKDDKVFSPVIPYYITHIYYMQKKYDELLEVAPDLLSKSTPKRKPEIARLIGESYYRTERYKESIPYLNQYYEAFNHNIGSINLYQMAYANYKIGNYNEAITYFKKIDDSNKEMLQSANYHLALCYVRVDKKPYALNAFNAAYTNDMDADITADALYNFAKISYELDYNPYNQALKAFEKYVTEYPNSVHREDAMKYLTKMYLSTNNYSQALQSIEKIQDMSPELLLAYQRILYSMAITRFNEEAYEESISFFDRSIALKKDFSYTAKSYYWKAECFFKQKEYDKSITNYKVFLTSTGAFSDENYNMAHYNIAYAYFFQKEYSFANKEFRIFVQNEKNQNTEFVNDAYNRIGDSYFIKKDYSLAVQNYDKALKIGKRNADYTLYKKAESLGPLKQYKQKAQAFEKLINDYPNSTYAGNAEYALAQLYNIVLLDREKAINYYDHIIATRPPQTSYVKKSKLDLGYLYSSSDTKKSIAIFKKLYQDYRGSEESQNALSALQNIYASEGNVDEFFTWAEVQGVQVALSTQDSANYYVAEEAYMNNDFDVAISKLDHYIERFPTGYFISKAHYYKADCERRIGKYLDAIVDYQYIINKPISKYSENSLKEVSEINYNIFKDYPAARVSYSKLRIVSESNELFQEATINIMRCDVYTENADSIIQTSTDVLALTELDPKVYVEAKMNIVRVYVQNKDYVNAVPILKEMSSGEFGEASSESMYNLALLDFNNQQYDSAEAKAYLIIQREPSYEYWVVKAFILSSDVFMQTDNMHQAKATLSSIIDNYNGDQELLQQAKDKYEQIRLIEESMLKTDESEEVIIDLGQDNNLFIDSEVESDEEFEIELEQEVEEQNINFNK